MIFKLYVRLVLPIDGFVFWVRADLVNPAAVYNAFQYNTAAYNQPQSIRQQYVNGVPIGQFISGTSPVGTIPIAPIIDVDGSFHYATTKHQDEDESLAVNKVIFTAESEVNDLNFVNPNLMYIGEFPAQYCCPGSQETIRFAFSQRQNFYEQAGLYHYIGDAIYPVMETQIIDSVAQLHGTAQIVNNSLPFWMSMSRYKAQPWEYYSNVFTVYPSYLLPNNIPPPFVAVHIEPGDTRAMASAPTLSRHSSHFQLCADKVEVTLYGLRNNNALDFVDFVNQYSVNLENFGITNIPCVRDEKKTQAELGIIAQKKRVTFEISYLQHRASDVARQLIESAIPTVYPQAP